LRAARIPDAVTQMNQRQSPLRTCVNEGGLPGVCTRSRSTLGCWSGQVKGSRIDQRQRAIRRRDVVAGSIAPISEQLAEVCTINLRVEVDVGAVG
jgi:hypothetical protein